ALLAAYPADYAGMLDMAERYHVDVNECERGVFGVDHCEAGQWLVREWKFPDEFLEIAGGHHHNGACGQVDKLTIVRLGCQMADAVGFGITGAEAAMSFASIEARLPARAGGRFSEVGDVALKVADRVNALECSLAG
ncbi:MAG: HDOD domain-containing protein, partial [Acidobacteria bacterium]|nr:HDOD domain-containing protein [Acidobacteriota bacterium]